MSAISALLITTKQSYTDIFFVRNDALIPVVYTWKSHNNRVKIAIHQVTLFLLTELVATSY